MTDTYPTGPSRAVTSSAPVASTSPAIDAVVFDLGGVLIEWDPRHLYRQLFPGDEEAMERFLAEICTYEWNARQDIGGTWGDAVRELTAEHPEWAPFIAAYDERWDEMVPGSVPGTPDILRELHDRGTRLLALSNWSVEKFVATRPRFAFLELFEALMISAHVGLAKPDPAIFRECIARFSLTPARTVFIDDSAANVASASAEGLVAIRFTDADDLRTRFEGMGLLARG
jgi:2-haloacid dehalogenase